MSVFATEEERHTYHAPRHIAFYKL